MTTAAQVKKMVRPVLARNPDLALVGRWLYVTPIEHFARAILIDRTAYADDFDPRWAVCHLFEQRTFFPLDWGIWLGNWRSPRPGLWRMTDPDVELSLLESIEKEALPVLRAMRTLDDFLAFVSNHELRDKLYGWPSNRIILDVALGDLEGARALADKHLPTWSDQTVRRDDYTRAEFGRLVELCRLLEADDRAGLATLLHQWEAATVTTFKIAHLWRPTPFPLETAVPS